MAESAIRLRERAIRALDVRDAEACQRLSALAGWTHGIEDWQARLRVGRGRGIRDSKGELVAIGLSLPGGPGIGFIGLVLTDPRCRGDGLGSAITAAIASELRNEGRTPCLFAVPKAVSLYERLGFRTRGQLDSRRGSLTPRSRREVIFSNGRSAGGVRLLAGSDLGAILALDRAAYGGNREALIEYQVSRHPNLAYLAEGDGGCRGFALGAVRRGETLIGPIVSETPASAVALLYALVEAAGPGPTRCDCLARERGDDFDRALDRVGLGGRTACQLMTLGSPEGPIFPGVEMLFAAQSAAAG